MGIATVGNFQKKWSTSLVCMGWLASIGRYHTRNVFLSRNFLPLIHDYTHFKENFLDFRPGALALLWFQREK